MNTTTNYGLKLYEGTDLFNPLTVENVNAGDIDTAMKAISDHSVGAATELTTGTVHALNRVDTDRDVFRFVATSNFTAGDTFTLDGNQVSALTPDGQPLATGSYVIGSTVLCALHDTLITVYVNPAKAKDADMLDGHDSSYYATDSDLDTVAGTIQAVSDKVGTAVLTTTAPDCSGAINELNTHLSDIVKVKTLSTSVTFNTGGSFQELNITVTPDAGYKCIGVVGYSSSQWPFYFPRCQLTSATNVNVLMVSTFNSPVTTNVVVDVLEVKI